MLRDKLQRKMKGKPGWLYGVLVLPLILLFLWKMAGWPLHPYNLSKAYMRMPEYTGIHVESVTEENGIVTFTAVNQLQQVCELAQSVQIDYRHRGTWWLAGGWPYPSSNFDIGQLIFPERPVAMQADLEAITAHAREERWPDGLYRLRFYDGIYEFELN